MSNSGIPKIVVKTDISELDTPDMVSVTLGIVFTGDPDATTPPVNDAALHGEADTLQAIHGKRQTNPPTATADDEDIQRKKVSRAYEKDARYVQDVANDVAEAAADSAAGEIVVTRIGFELKQQATPHARSFEVYDSGVAWVHVRTKAVAKKAAYVWQYGITAAKGTPPAIDINRTIVNLEADIKLTNLESGEIYGFRYATVEPGEKGTHSDGEEPLTFSDWIYFVVE